MSDNFAQQFIDRLQQMEQSGEVDPLLALFAGDARLQRVNGDAETGRAGARRFWQEYLSAFDSVRSTFNHVYRDGDTIVLEWVSQAEPETEPSFEYPGVSILEVDGDKIHAFRTYYDSAAFIQKRATGGAA